ncbi:hypothetical protein GTQ40_17870 [Flavobacteriaceae bacterium R38]|nr:hypothetical protein [Flavobacteriaceae bacterium R38]
MKSSYIIILIFISVFTMKAQENAFVIEDVSVFDGDKIIKNRYILIENSQIKEITSLTCI